MGSFSRTVTDNVNAAIADAGRPLLQLAEAAGIPRSTLMRRLSGASAFTVSELEALAAALDIDVTELTRPQAGVA